MLDSRLTVVLSQGQSRNPEKRQLENELAEGAAAIDGVHVLVVPHLYDLPRDGETYRTLQAIQGDMVVCAWLYDRATHWVLDRHGVRGQVGVTELKGEADDSDDEDPTESVDSLGPLDRVIDAQPRPSRTITCLDLRVSARSSDFVAEVARIAQRQTTIQTATSSAPTLLGTKGVVTIDEHPVRRWYPVIDFSRCTNCMECIDFCLFGVYGIDNVETILVEQPDNCRKGCPACSRVCPQNAIIFPQHKTPAIAGAPMDAGGLKIDLSKLFGAPEEGADAIEVAARERDEQLLLAGRQAVGVTEDLASRIAKSSTNAKDDLDNLLDQLDSLEL